MKPDTNTPSHELFRAFIRRERSEIRVLPRGDGVSFPVRFKVLTYAEHEKCQLQALDHFKKSGLDRKDISADTLADRVACEVLWRASREPDIQTLKSGKEVYHPFFPSVDELTEELTTDEIAMFFRNYSIVQYKLSPNWTELSTEDIDIWINRLADGVEGAMAENFLSSLSLPELHHLIRRTAEHCRSMASQLPDSPYALRFLSENSNADITLSTEQSSDINQEKLEISATSELMSQGFSHEKQNGSGGPPKSILKSKEEIQALAESLRNTVKK